MAKQTRGAACIDAGGVYVGLLNTNQCERIELVGALLTRARVVEVIECLVIPKWSPPLLAIALEKEFGPLIACDDSEIVYMYYDTRVELTLATRGSWASVLQSMKETA